MKPIPIELNVRAWLAILGVLAVAACGGGGGDSGATSGNNLTPASTQAAVSELTDAFATTLTGAQSVPQRQSAATGSGTVVIQPATRLMTATLTTTGIVGTDAHIRQASAGLNGPVVFPLAETTRGSGIWTGRATLTEAQYNAFRASDFYFNVASANFAEGEIRGQILSQQPGTTPTTSTGTNTGTPTASTSTGAGLNPFVSSTATFLSALRGGHEVPPTPSAATGSGTVLLNPANRQLIAGVTTSSIAGTAAHIHEAAPGVNGPIIIPLAEPAAGSGTWTANVILTEPQFNALLAGNLYFNVHSSAFPNGEIRGQILPQTISLEFVTGAAGRPAAATTPTGTTGTGTTGTGTAGTGTGSTGTGATGIVTTGPGLPGTGATGIGTTGTGLPGTGTTGIGITGTGLTGTGTTGIGTTGTGLTGTGTTGIGVFGTGLTGTGTTGIGTTGSGLTGTGTTGIGTTGTGLTGIGTTGIGTTSTGLIGTGTTGIGTTSTGLIGTGTTGIGTTSTGLIGTGTTGIGSTSTGLTGLTGMTGGTGTAGLAF